MRKIANDGSISLIPPITPTNAFKGRQYPGEVILLAVRWYLRYPLAYLHISEILSERGLFVDASCIWRWVQTDAPELDRRCRPHLKTTNKSYRVDETYIRSKAKTDYLYPGNRFNRPDHRFSAHGKTRHRSCQTLLPQSVCCAGEPQRHAS
jgi:hypothetical protein